MASQDILQEAKELKNVCQRLELVAERHPPPADALVTICGTSVALRCCWKCSWRRNCLVFPVRFDLVSPIEQLMKSWVCTIACLPKYEAN